LSREISWPGCLFRLAFRCPSKLMPLTLKSRSRWPVLASMSSEGAIRRSIGLPVPCRCVFHPCR
jgi:hypothetical protein